MQLQLQQQAATAAAAAMRGDTPAAVSQQQPWMMTPGLLTNPGNLCLIESLRAMAVAVQQPSAECTAHCPPPCVMTIQKTCTDQWWN